MTSEEKALELQLFASRIRLETLKTFKSLGFGHLGGAMSIIETLAVLYGSAMNINPAQPDWPDRDWLILSKGHAGPALYAALALKGYFSPKELKTLNQPGTSLPSHCDRLKTTGIDMTTGSLGQGISTAIGIALGNRLDARENYTYLILGDGECNEGQVWEGTLFAAHHKVSRLIALIDYNKQQLDGYTRDIMDLDDLAAKFMTFGWHVQEIDGHNPVAVDNAILEAKSEKEKPSAVILNTVKGKSCNFAEGVLDNHNMIFSDEMIDEAIRCMENELQLVTSRLNEISTRGGEES